MADVTPDSIMRIAMGFMAAKNLFVASEIGLFEKLAVVPATLDELAGKTGIPRRTLRISLDAMLSLGLLERDGERYRNSGGLSQWRKQSRSATDVALLGQDQLSGMAQSRDLSA